MSEEVYLCEICGYPVKWELNAEIDDFGWWCETCGEWIPSKDVKEATKC